MEVPHESCSCIINQWAYYMNWLSLCWCHAFAETFVKRQTLNGCFHSFRYVCIHFCLSLAVSLRLLLIDFVLLQFWNIFLSFLFQWSQEWSHPRNISSSQQDRWQSLSLSLHQNQWVDDYFKWQVLRWLQLLCIHSFRTCMYSLFWNMYPEIIV